MFNLSNQTIYIYKEPMDMRNSFEGLSKAIVDTFQIPVTQGSYFVFLNKPRDKIKIIFWDVDGLVIWYKRLEKGTFRLTKDMNNQLNRKEFLMLLEGIDPKKIYPRFSL